MKKLVPVIAGVAVATVAVGALVAFSRPDDARPRRPSPPIVSAPPPAPRTAYEEAVDAANRHGLRVWIETDLVKRWSEGPEAFNQAVTIVASLARRPGVVGIKIADELGYRDSLTSEEKVAAFLAASAGALRAAAPGKLLLADVFGPELGCLPGYDPPLRWATVCGVQARGQYPQLALTAIDDYLRSGNLDVVNLSTGLLPDKTYAGWGIDQDVAQRTAWQEAHRRGWDTLVRLQARKALAHPGEYTDTATDQTLATFIDIPTAEGAGAVDVWTWRQLYKGQIHRLMDPGLKPNALWDGLVKRHASGMRLFTHLSPQSLEVGLDPDLAVVATAFTDLFVAAGTG